MADETLFAVTYDDKTRWLISATRAEDAIRFAAGLLAIDKTGEPDPDAVDQHERERLGAQAPSPDERQKWDECASTFAPGSEVAPAAVPISYFDRHRDESI